MLPILGTAVSTSKILKWVGIPLLILGLAFSFYLLGRKDQKIKTVEQTNRVVETRIERSEETGRRANEVRETIRRSRENTQNRADPLDDLRNRATFYSCLLQSNSLENNCSQRLRKGE